MLWAWDDSRESGRGSTCFVCFVVFFPACMDVHLALQDRELPKQMAASSLVHQEHGLSSSQCSDTWDSLLKPSFIFA